MKFWKIIANLKIKAYYYNSNCHLACILFKYQYHHTGDH
jgi:hypothetical protein